MKSNKEIIKQFIGQGASPRQAEDLYLFSQNLKNLTNIQRPLTTKQHFLQQIEKNQRSFGFVTKPLFIFVSLILFFIVSGFLISVQASKPGELLYPLKKLTNAVSLFIGQSIYRGYRGNALINTNGQSNNDSNSSNSAKTERLDEEKDGGIKENTLNNNQLKTDKDKNEKNQTVEGIQTVDTTTNAVPTIVEKTKDTNKEEKDQSLNNNPVENVGGAVDNTVSNTQNTLDNATNNTTNILGL